MRIALIQCPAFGIDRPPIALAYLAAAVRRQGHEASIFDFNIDLYSKTEEKNKKFWDFEYVFQWVDKNCFFSENLLLDIHFKKWIKEVIDFKPDVVGFSIQSSSLRSSINLAKFIKSIIPHVTIIFGGPLFSTYGEIEHIYSLLELRTENVSKVRIIDIIVLGEGEETLNEVLHRIGKKLSLEGCLGTVVVENGRNLKNNSRPLLTNLDLFPFADFRGFPNNYKHKRRLPILGSRGCIRNCTFCDDCRMWKHYRFRSAQNIVDEIKLRKIDKVEFLEFNDLLINGNLKQLFELCHLLIKEKLNMPWGGSAAVRPEMNLDFLKKMREAGCQYLNYGIESGSEKVLKEMNKGFTLEDAEKVIRDTYKARIKVCTNWIVGFPSETQKDFIDTLKFIKKNREYLKSGLMVNNFIFKANSFLSDNVNKYDIAFDGSGDWYCSANKNTREERQRRFELFNRFASLKGLEIAHKTILEIPRKLSLHAPTWVRVEDLRKIVWEKPKGFKAPNSFKLQLSADANFSNGTITRTYYADDSSFWLVEPAGHKGDLYIRIKVVSQLDMNASESQWSKVAVLSVTLPERVKPPVAKFIRIKGENNLVWEHAQDFHLPNIYKIEVSFNENFTEETKFTYHTQENSVLLTCFHKEYFNYEYLYVRMKVLSEPNFPIEGVWSKVAKIAIIKNLI